MIRFNEAVDQMVAESVRQCAQRTERIRDLFVGVLSHGMRSPADAILNSAHVMLRDQNLSSESSRAGVNLKRSAERLKLLIDDLFVFTRTRLGDSLPIEPTRPNFPKICRDAVEEVRAAKPDARIQLHVEGEMEGYWDAAHVNQVIVNLVTNEFQDGNGAIDVYVTSDSSGVTLAVSNEGTPIQQNALATLFDPLTRSDSSPQHGRASSRVGCGLYICRCIVIAHQGTITVESNENATRFMVRLPWTSTSVAC